MTHIDVLIGSRVRITSNEFVEGAIYNGQMGTVLGFVYEGNGPTTPDDYCPKDFGFLQDHEREMPIVLIQIDGDIDYSCSKIIPRLVPFGPIEGRVIIGGDYKRWQYPFLVAHARTGHSIQGFTARHGIVVDLGSNFFGGDYVALGRATCLAKILLLHPAKLSYFTDHVEYRYIVDKFYASIEKLFPQSD